MPATAAKAASERNRPACDQLTSTWAALRGQRLNFQQPGRDRTDQHGELGRQLIGLGLQQLDALGSGPQRAAVGAVLH